MHSAWFNEGGAPVSETTVPMVRSNSTVYDPASRNPVINVSSTLMTIYDLYLRAFPGTTTIKFDLSNSDQLRDIANTQEFLTYTTPFTVETVFADSANYDYVYISARAFDTVTGESQQTGPFAFQTRVIPQPGGGGAIP